MSKAPAQVEKFSDDSIETVAYSIAAQFTTRELNDNNRLGYHIWRYLTGSYPTIDEAVRESGVRLIEEETVQKITEKISEDLKEKGFEVRRQL